MISVAEQRPTLMVLDLMMPRVDGFEVLRSLRLQPNTRDLPVVVVTAKDLTDLTEDDRDRLARNAERVIVKQAIPLEGLRQEVRDVLARRRSQELAG